MRRLDRSEREGFDSLAWVEEGLGAVVRGAGFGDERKKRIGPACTEVLSQTIPLLRKHAYPQITAGAERVAQFEKEGDVVFRDAISKLFHDPAIDAKELLREKEVLDDLEKAVNRCEQVADALTGIAVKHA